MPCGAPPVLKCVRLVRGKRACVRLRLLPGSRHLTTLEYGHTLLYEPMHKYSQ